MKKFLFILFILANLMILSTAGAQEGVQWSAGFFNTPYLTGEPVVTVGTSAIAYNWGTNAPLDGIPASAFSVRFATDAFFPGGTYRFYVLAKDRAALKVDFQTYINTIDASEGKPKEILTADVQMKNGVTHIQLDFQKLGDDAWVYLDWEPLDGDLEGPNFTIPGEQPEQKPPGDPVPVNNSTWTGEYFANVDLSGTPSFSQIEASPDHNWDLSAPVANIGADNFSVRWTSRQYFDGSPHQFTVKADDGIRVYVNGILYIDEWHAATDQVYKSPIITLVTGTHEVRVEFYEAQGAAFVEYDLNKFVNVIPAPITRGTAVVTAGRLNVRNLPTASNSQVITKINRDEVYPIVGRNADSTWWLIEVNGIQGWVSAAYVDATNTSQVPIVDPNNLGGVVTPVPTPAGTIYTITTTAGMNIYSSPNANSSIVGTILQGQSAVLVSRSLSGSWFKINFSNTVGWVSARFVTLPSNINYNDIPIESN